MLNRDLVSEVYQLEDKRPVVLRDLSIAVIVGYQHPPGEYIAYTKYVYTGKGLWKGYERLVKKYSPSDVLTGRVIYDPNFETKVPIVSMSNIIEAPDPLKRMEEILSSPKDEHENEALTVKEKTSLDLGISGSLLLKIHHKRSDIDLLIYSKYEDAWEILREYGKTDPQWIVNVSERVGLDIETVKRYYYSKAIRSIWNKYPISFSYVKRYYREQYGSFPRRTNRIYEGEITLGDVEDRTFLYPHFRKGSVNVLSFESAYLRLLVECEKVWVKAPVFESDEETFVVLGTKEYPGVMKPRQPCR